MATDLEKKKQEAIALAQQGTNDLVTGLQGAADTYTNAADAASAAYKQGQEDLINQMEQGNAAIREEVKNAYDQTYGEGGDFYKIAQARKDAYDAAQRENEQRLKTDYNTAKWTGITEAAANLVNLIGVGAGASHQPIHQYSQDWMRKADADAKERRNRIDRLREQQDALKAQIANGKLQGAMALANLDKDALGRVITMRGDLGKTAYQSDMQKAGILYGNAAEQAKAKGAGADKVLNTGLAFDKMAFEAGEHAKNRAATLQAAAMRQSGSGGGGILYDATIDGRKVRLQLSKATLDEALVNGGSDLKKDIARMAMGRKANGQDYTWNDFLLESERRGSAAKKWADEHPEIIDALKRHSEESDDVIAHFIQTNGDDLNNFNKHLSRVANGASAIGGGEMSSTDFLNMINGTGTSDQE